MIELNNIDFSNLEKTCELPAEYHEMLFGIVEKAAVRPSASANIVAAFELGASLAHQEKTQKVCVLLKPM